MAGRKAETNEIVIDEVSGGVVTMCILGTTPLIYNRMSEKAKRDLSGLVQSRKSKADKAASLKHDFLAEYRRSMHRRTDPNSPTLLCAPALWFKKAAASVATDLAGVSKAAVGRSLWARGQYGTQHIDIYGVPQLGIDMVRTPDINHTPDVRTRAYVPQWAATVTMSYAIPILTERKVVTLVANAGMLRGVGDNRAEKGNGDFGSFCIANPDDETFREIVRTGGRAAQEEAYQKPEFVDEETQEFYDWFYREVEAAGRTSQLWAA